MFRCFSVSIIETLCSNCCIPTLQPYTV
jgi:hypothetical protein